MNNLSSYCGLVDAKIRASDKDLPVLTIVNHVNSIEIHIFYMPAKRCPPHAEIQIGRIHSLNYGKTGYGVSLVDQD